MQSESSLSRVGSLDRLKAISHEQWDKLTDRQKLYAKKAWGIITYKWRWQIAMNIPYVLIFALDKTVPAVHKFDLKIISYITSKLPVPEFMTSLFG